MNWPERLAVAAVRYRAGLLAPQDLQDIVEGMMDDGIYIDAFAGTQGLRRPHHDDIAGPFLGALAHYGIALPDFDDAMQYMARLHIRKIANGEVEPWPGILDFMRDIWDMREDFNILADEREVHRQLRPLALLYYTAEDLYERRDRAQADGMPFAQLWADQCEEIRQGARRWLEQYDKPQS